MANGLSGFLGFWHLAWIVHCCGLESPRSGKDQLDPVG
jgi:hypothetical protein